jgi:hypothetical protein
VIHILVNLPALGAESGGYLAQALGHPDHQVHEIGGFGLLAANADLGASEISGGFLTLETEHLGIHLYSPYERSLKADYQKHLESLWCIDGMGDVAGQEDRFSTSYSEFLFVDRYFPYSVQRDDQCIPAACVGTDLLAFFECKQREAVMLVLGKCLADHLSILILDQICKDLDFGCFEILEHQFFSSCLPSLVL